MCPDAHKSPSQMPVDCHTKRQRTSKACDQCRTKKLKCDGIEPCSRCSRIGTDCSYLYVEKKRSIGKRRSKNMIVKDLDQRLFRLETMIETLINKVDVTSSSGQYSTDEQELMSTSELGYSPQNNENYTSSNSSNDNNDNNNDKDTLHRKLVKSIRTELPFVTDNSEKLPITNQGPHSQSEQAVCGHYVGEQCSFSVFSSKGLACISQRVSDVHAVEPLQEMLHYIYPVIYNEFQDWTQAMDIPSLSPLPCRGVMKQLLDLYNECVLPVKFIVSREEIEELYESYLSVLKNEKPKRKIAYPEMLILHTAASIGCLVRLELEAVGIIKPEHEDYAYYIELGRQQLRTALYFFSKSMMLPEGLISISSCVLLVMNLWLTLPEFDYHCVSACIRMAQCLGFHRSDTTVGLPEDEVLRRKKLWIWCYIYDKDLCFRCGKPPIIHESDTNSLDFVYHESLIEQYKIEASLSITDGVSDKVDFDNWNNFQVLFRILFSDDLKSFNCMAFFPLKLSHISSRAYELIFSANALVNKSRHDIFNDLEGLNQELNILKLKLPIFIRPGYDLKIPQTESPSLNYSIYTQLIYLHLYYHFVVLFINRSAFIKDSLNESDRTLQKNGCDLLSEVRCLELGLESARAILKLTVSIKPLSLHHLDRLLFITGSAFIAVFISTIDDVTRLGVKEDIILMMKICDVYVKQLDLEKYHATSINKYGSLVSSFKIFTQIAITHFKKSCDDTFEATFEHDETKIDAFRDKIRLLYRQIVKDNKLDTVSNILRQIASKNMKIETNEINATSSSTDTGLNPDIESDSRSVTTDSNPFNINYVLNKPNSGRIPSAIDDSFRDTNSNDTFDMGTFPQHLFGMPSYLFDDSALLQGTFLTNNA